ncbi:MAG: hypothetical protein ACRDNK_01335, partial [Solirubrobacteraceae bacterium]
MNDDLNRLATMSADLMTRIETQYGDDIQLRTIAIAVEVDLPKSTTMILSSSDGPRVGTGCVLGEDAPAVRRDRRRPGRRRR